MTDHKEDLSVFFHITNVLSAVDIEARRTKGEADLALLERSAKVKSRVLVGCLLGIFVVLMVMGAFREEYRFLSEALILTASVILALFCGMLATPCRLHGSVVLWLVPSAPSLLWLALWLVLNDVQAQPRTFLGGMASLSFFLSSAWFVMFLTDQWVLVADSRDRKSKEVESLKYAPRVDCVDIEGWLEVPRVIELREAVRAECRRFTRAEVDAMRGWADEYAKTEAVDRACRNVYYGDLARETP